MIQALLRVSIMQRQDMVTREHILNEVDPDISMHYHAFVIKGYGARYGGLQEADSSGQSYPRLRRSTTTISSVPDTSSDIYFQRSPPTPAHTLHLQPIDSSLPYQREREPIQ